MGMDVFGRYPLDLAHLNAWASFLEACGGFEIN